MSDTDRPMAVVSPGSWARSWLRLRRLFLKEFLQLVRDRRSLTMLFVAPILQLLLYGYAITTEVRNLSTVVLDRDETQASRSIADALVATGYFRVTRWATDRSQVARALDQGAATLAIEIPRGYSRSLLAGRPLSIQLLLDGANANTATVAEGYAMQIVEAQGAKLLARSAADVPVLAPVTLESRAWYNPGLESRVYFVPAIAANIMLNMGLMLTALGVVREREQGTMEQLLVSPVTPLEIVVGKVLPVAMVVLVNVAIVDLVGIYWFDVPFRGGVILLSAASLTFTLAGLGAGILLSAIAKTQQEVSMSVFPVLMPMMLLSGMIFPISSMPRVIQWLTLANPLRYQIAILRSVFLKGAGVAELWPQLVPMVVMAVGLMLVAAWRFNRRLA
jgi:ABC-2 type transport system permease protein